MKKMLTTLLCLSLLVSCSKEDNQFLSQTNLEKISFKSDLLKKGGSKKDILKEITSFLDMYKQFNENPENFSNKVMNKEEALLLVEASVNYTYPFVNKYRGKTTKTTAPENQIVSFKEVEENTITLQSAFKSLKSIFNYLETLGIDNKEKLIICTDLSLVKNHLSVSTFTAISGQKLRLPYMAITNSDSWFGFYGGKCANTGSSNNATNAAEHIEDIINHNWQYGYYQMPYNYGDTVVYYNPIITHHISGNNTLPTPINFPLISSSNQNICIPPFPSNNPNLNMQSLTNSYKNFIFSTIGPNLFISVDFYADSYSTVTTVGNSTNASITYFHSMEVVSAGNYFIKI